MFLKQRHVHGIARQFVRYIITGGVAFAVDFALLYLFTDILSFHYRVGTCVGYITGLVITYTLSVTWIFDEHRTDNRWLEFPGFVLIGVIGLAATHLFMWLLSEFVLGTDLYLLSKIVTTGMVSILNFILKKYILFSKTK